MYKIFEKLSKSRNVTPYFVSKETGVAYSTLSAWKKGSYHPKDDKLEIIADYFDVPLAYLKGTQKDLQCSVCHMDYNPIDEKSNAKHTAYHEKFLEVQHRYHVTIPSRAEAEQERMDALSILRDVKYDKFRRISAFNTYAKLDFICYLYDSDFETDADLDAHVKAQAELLRPDNAISLNLCNEIRSEFGVDEYKEDSKITEREYKIICKYRELPEEVANVIDKILDV